MEDRTVLSGGGQGLGVALAHLPTAAGQAPSVVQTLQGTDVGTVPASGGQGLGVALAHLPTAAGQAPSVVQALQGTAQFSATGSRQDAIHRPSQALGGQAAAHRQDAIRRPSQALGGQAAAHRQDAIHRPSQALGGQGAAQRVINRAVAGLNQASTNLARIASSSSASAQKGLSRALSAVQKGAVQLDSTLSNVAPTSGQDAAKAAVQQALANLGQLDGKVPADQLAPIQATLQDVLNRISSAGSTQA